MKAVEAGQDKEDCIRPGDIIKSVNGEILKMLIFQSFLRYILLCRILANRRKTTTEHAQREYKNALKTHQPELRKMKKICENQRKSDK